VLSEKEIPKWRQYEWLISKIFHDEYATFSTKVINNSSVIGEYSERSRQIDVLVESDHSKTMIECKYYSRPIDIKAVEAFLSMFSDVKADLGILISSSGFTKSAVKRIREFPKQITLEHIDWESAYKSSFSETTYGQMEDVCSHCFDKYESGKEVPGLLCWEHGFAIELQGKVDIYSIAKCLKCNSKTVYCQACGCVSLAECDETCCDNRDVFLECYNET
jgi:hypothetical protein